MVYEGDRRRATVTRGMMTIYEKDIVEEQQQQEMCRRQKATRQERHLVAMELERNLVKGLDGDIRRVVETQGSDNDLSRMQHNGRNGDKKGQRTI